MKKCPKCGRPAADLIWQYCYQRPGHRHGREIVEGGDHLFKRCFCGYEGWIAPCEDTVEDRQEEKA